MDARTPIKDARTPITDVSTPIKDAKTPIRDVCCCAGGQKDGVGPGPRSLLCQPAVLIFNKGLILKGFYFR